MKCHNCSKESPILINCLCLECYELNQKIEEYQERKEEEEKRRKKKKKKR